MVEADWSVDFIQLNFNVEEAKNAAGDKIEFAEYLDNLYTELCNKLENTYYGSMFLFPQTSYVETLSPKGCYEEVGPLGGNLR